MQLNKFLSIFFLSLFINSSSIAEIPHFLDFKYILNSSSAGKKAQDYLKNKLNNGLKNITNKEKEILDEEKKIISQKKVISQEE
jgi:Skp family chaperone for outer membrane proteins